MEREDMSIKNKNRVIDEAFQEGREAYDKIRKNNPLTTKKIYSEWHGSMKKGGLDGRESIQHED